MSIHEPAETKDLKSDLRTTEFSSINVAVLDLIPIVSNGNDRPTCRTEESKQLASFHICSAIV